MKVTHPFKAGEQYVCNNNLSFMIFSVMSAMVFLGPLSLAKYGLWIICMGVMMIHWQKKWNWPMTLYLVFILWNVYTLTYTTHLHQGLMMIIKFSLPILYFWLGYNAITGTEDLIVFFKKVSIITVVYSFFIGGLSCKLWNPLYELVLYKSDSLFISYASLADFYATLICVPIAMFLCTRDKKYLIAAALLLLSSILDSVRTGIGAIMIGAMMLLLYHKRSSSVPLLLILAMLFLTIFLMIPEIRDKSFAESGYQVEVSDASSIDWSRVDKNGREYTWEIVKEQCYYRNPVVGSGCGSALGWLKDRSKGGGVALVHSDWVQMMSESGNVGLFLYLTFAILLLVLIFAKVLSLKRDLLVSILGGVVAASFAACFFCMAFDNVITYAQQAYVYPFMLYGIFQKVLDLKSKKGWV